MVCYKMSEKHSNIDRPNDLEILDIHAILSNDIYTKSAIKPKSPITIKIIKVGRV